MSIAIARAAVEALPATPNSAEVLRRLGRPWGVDRIEPGCAIRLAMDARRGHVAHLPRYIDAIRAVHPLEVGPDDTLEECLRQAGESAPVDVVATLARVDADPGAGEPVSVDVEYILGRMLADARYVPTIVLVAGDDAASVVSPIMAIHSAMEQRGDARRVRVAGPADLIAVASRVTP